MELDPQVRALLKLFEGRPAVNTLPVEVGRRGYSESMAKLVPRPAAPVGVDRVIQGPGGDLKLRIYRAEGAQGALPLIVYFHGGGWVLCDLDTHDALCRNLATEAQAVIVSVDYRMAPEHLFPAAPEDCMAATRWAMAQAAELGIDPARTVVAGDSAGGNLAAAVALRARDEGLALAGQLLIYPVTAHYTAAFDSYAEFATGYGLTREVMVWFWDLYLGGARTEQQARELSVQAAPMLAQDLRGLPPTLVITAAVDVLRDEGEAYGMRLVEAGVPTTLTRYPGMHHGFFTYPGVLDGANRAAAQAGEWVRALPSAGHGRTA
ncbi:MAG: alpha/beta hydrolase [Burkholderiaceae bacterium]